jgi:hypothetical protein
MLVEAASAACTLLDGGHVGEGLLAARVTVIPERVEATIDDARPCVGLVALQCDQTRLAGGGLGDWPLGSGDRGNQGADGALRRGFPPTIRPLRSPSMVAVILRIR